MNFIQKFWIWFGVKILRWEFIDIYSKDSGNKVKDEDIEVTSITFSNSKSYINKIMRIE